MTTFQPPAPYLESHPLERTAWGAHVAVRIVLILLFVTVLTACEATQKMNTQETPPIDPMRPLTEPFDLEKVAAFIGQPFPASATNIHAQGEAALDTMVIARFDLPRQNLSQYLTSLGLISPLAAGYSPFFSTTPPMKEAETWWFPPNADEASSAFSGIYQQLGNKNYKVVVIKPDEEIVTVYLQVYST